MRKEAMLESLSSQTVLRRESRTAFELLLLEAFIVLSVDHVNTTKEGTRIPFQDLWGSIAEMNIDIHDSHTFQSPTDTGIRWEGQEREGETGKRLPCIQHGDGSIVEKTKACAWTLLSETSSSNVMSRRSTRVRETGEMTGREREPHAAEDIGVVSAHHDIYRSASWASRTDGSFETVGTHVCVDCRHLHIQVRHWLRVLWWVLCWEMSEMRARERRRERGDLPSSGDEGGARMRLVLREDVSLEGAKM
jgi:hypothetical protein